MLKPLCQESEAQQLLYKQKYKLEFPFLDSRQAQISNDGQIGITPTAEKLGCCQKMKEKELRVCVYTCKPRDASKLEYWI